MSRARSRRGAWSSAHRSRLAALTTLLLFCVSADARAEAKAPVRGLAYNVQFDSKRTGDSLDAIAAADADVACLEELTAPFARAFEARFSAKYPHRFLIPRAGTWGIGIASRYPLAAVHRFAAAPSRMPAVEATVRTPSGPVRVVCLHLFPPVAKRDPSAGFVESIRDNAALRVEQAKRLVKRYRRVAPVVLMGDFNESTGDAAVKTLLEAKFADACSVSGASCRSTWPGPSSPWPAVARIDLILGRGVRFTAARVPDGGGSDHRPMTASFVLR